MTPVASVIVPTCRRADLLVRCLAALVEQQVGGEPFEVIVADDAGDRRTAEAALRFMAAGPPSIRYLAVGPRHGPAAARNAGARAARAAVLAFTDDDCLPARTWLREGLAALRRRPEAAAVAGRVVVPTPARPTDYERDAAGLSCGEFVTANCLCRRDAFWAVGGFDERFTRAWREDSDLQFTLLERGFSVVRADEAVVVHPVRPAPWGVSLRQQRKTAFNALLYKKHPRLYRERIEPTPWSYYAAVAALAAGGAGLAAGSAPLVAAAGGCWLALTGAFCRRRLRGASRAPSHIAEMALTSALIPPLSLFWMAQGMVRRGVVFR